MIGKDKKIILALYQSNWTTPKIAQAMERSRGSVASLISRDELSKSDRGLSLNDALKAQGLYAGEFS